MMSRTTILAGLVLLFAFGQSSDAQDLQSSVGYPSDYEPLYPYDSPEPWLHGHFQRMPFYGGFRSFRPYNYKHVLSQTQASAGWGMNPRLPYSQQFWHKYHRDATMSPYEAENRRDLSGLQPGQQPAEPAASMLMPPVTRNQVDPYQQAPMPPAPLQPPVFGGQSIPAQPVSAPSGQRPVLLIPGN